jgi:hypothetical protein
MPLATIFAGCAPDFRVGVLQPSPGNVQFLSWLFGRAGWGERNIINYLAGFDVQPIF